MDMWHLRLKRAPILRCDIRLPQACGSASTWAARRSKASRLPTTGRERLRRRIAAPRGDYASTLAAVAGLVRDIERRARRARHGRHRHSRARSRRRPGCIKNSNSTWLNGRPLADDLSRLLDRPIRFANDANCFALSEATDGAAAGADVVFGVIVGTGTGGGVVDRSAGAGRRERDWRRVGAQPAAGRARRRVARAAVLLRPERLHRDVPVGPGAGARLRRRAAARSVTAQEIAARAAAGEPLADRGARPVRGADGARARQRHQPARSGRHRARRRAVEHRSPLRARAAALGAAHLLGPRRHAPRPREARRLERRPRRGVAVGTTSNRATKNRWAFRTENEATPRFSLRLIVSASRPARARRRRRRPGARAPLAPAGTAARAS